VSTIRQPRRRTGDAASSRSGAGIFSFKKTLLSGERPLGQGAAINVITNPGSNNFHGSPLAFPRPGPERRQSREWGWHYIHRQTRHTSRQWFGAPPADQSRRKLFAFFAFERQRSTPRLLETPQAFQECSLVTNWEHSRLQPSPRPFFENRLQTDRPRLHLQFQEFRIFLSLHAGQQQPE